MSHVTYYIWCSGICGAGGSSIDDCTQRLDVRVSALEKKWPDLNLKWLEGRLKVDCAKAPTTQLDFRYQSLEVMT